MEIVVYSSVWCPDCRVAKRFLQQHGVSYKEIDIESTPGAAEEVVARTGKRAIPQFVIDGEWVQPYREGEDFSMRRCPNGWALKSLKSTRT